jgi:twitching motility protein PilT
MGEIRDFESARNAIQAAETGHLVISTMHTSTVVETMERLTHLMPPEERRAALSLLSNQLIGVLTQKLLPAAGDTGRHVVTEFFQNEGATRDWIQEMDYARLEDFIASGQSGQCQSFRKSLLQGWKEQRITRETVLEAAANPQELERLMRGVS